MVNFISLKVLIFDYLGENRNFYYKKTNKQKKHYFDFLRQSFCQGKYSLCFTKCKIQFWGFFKISKKFEIKKAIEMKRKAFEKEGPIK